MSVIRVELKADGRQVKQTFANQWRTTITTIGSETWRRTEPVVRTSGQITFCVFCDSAHDLPISLLQDARLPKLGANYAENGVVYDDVYYMDATPRYIGPRGSYFMWEIAYTVGGEYSNAEQAKGNEQEATLLSFSTSVDLEDYASAVDLDGRWNCNSLGEWFADPLIFKTGILNLNYRRKEYENPLGKSRDFFQATNASPWHGFATGAVKCAELTFTANMFENYTEYDVAYKLQYRPTGWTVQKANAGFYCVSGNSVALVTNDDGSPVDSPALLAANGTLLPSGAAPVMRAYRVTNSADFDLLGLPDPFSI